MLGVTLGACPQLCVCATGGRQVCRSNGTRALAQDLALAQALDQEQASSQALESTH